MTRSNRRKYQKVIRKEWKRMLALSMACTMTVSMAVPAVAAQEGETSLQTAEAAELQETPEQFEARTGNTDANSDTNAIGNTGCDNTNSGTDRDNHTAICDTGSNHNTGSGRSGAGGRSGKYTGYYRISTVGRSAGDRRRLPFLDGISQQKSSTGEGKSGDQRRDV